MIKIYINLNQLFPILKNTNFIILSNYYKQSSTFIIQINRCYKQLFSDMFEKLKDGANKLKAKIGGDQLDEKLAEVVSEQNWQASTQQLHEVANAAYNYEKWQRINEFIWEKLKKSKSWKKILKTLNLIEFLLKNGPPSILSNFKYEVYQLRTFQSYSNYVEGVDKGETIRERAKVVVGLLGNEELLEEQRVKAKAIRQKMANVVGGTTYGSGSGSGSGYGGSYGGGYGGNDSYGYGSKPDKQKKKAQNNAYNYGSTTGHFGDYTYEKSTLDKYKDASKNNKNSSANEPKKEERKYEQPADTKKPFEKIANKLSKPGEKREERAQETRPVSSIQTSTPKASNNQIIDLFSNDPTPTQPPTSPAFSFEQPKPQVQQPIQPQVQQPNLPQYLPPQQPQQQQLYQQPQQQQIYQQQPQQQQIYQQQPPQQIFQPPQQIYQPPQAPQQQFYQQTQQPASQNSYQQPFGQQQPLYNNQLGGIPNQFGAFNQPNTFGYPQQPVSQANPYGNPQFSNAGIPQNGFNQYGNPSYPQNAPTSFNNVQQQQQQPPQATGFGNITLSTNTKQTNAAGLVSSDLGTAQNVNWLSNKEKGLIDFSDFGSEIKKETKSTAKSSQVSNNIQIDAWSW